MKKIKFPFAGLFACGLLTMVAGLYSCNEDEVVVPSNLPGSEDSQTHVAAPIPFGSFPLMDKTFGFMWSSGYLQTTETFGFLKGTQAHCETGGLNDDEHIRVNETYYNGIHSDTIMIQYHNVALNPICTVGSGSTSDGEVTPGYILFDRNKAEKDFWLEGDAKSEFLKYVSVVRFSLSATSTTGSGLALYKSVNLGEYKLVGRYMPHEVDKGEFFSVAVNESNVNLKFVGMGNNEGYIRMHDLQVYGEPVPERAFIYAEEYFNKPEVWNIEGYPLPLPPIPYVDYTPEIPEGKEWTESDNGLKGIPFVPLAGYQEVDDIEKSVSYPSGITLHYTIKDGAINPYCYNHHGNLSLIYGLTKGYIDLPVRKSALPRTDINASLEIGQFPSVSIAEFWLSTDSMDCNHEIWYKAKGFSDYKLLTRFAFDKFCGIGKYLRLKVDAEEVSFLIRPGEGSRNGKGYLYNGKYIGIDRKTKVHGIRVWSKGK